MSSPYLRRVKHGFFWRWEVSPPPSEDPVGLGLLVTLTECSTKEDVFIRGLPDKSAVTITSKPKAVIVEGVKELTLSLPSGAVASLELVRCHKVAVSLEGPLSLVRIDDCRDVVLRVGDAALLGFTSAGGSGEGLRVTTSGCHGCRAVWGEGGEAKIADTIVTLLRPGRPVESVIMRAGGEGSAGWGLGGGGCGGGAAAAATDGTPVPPAPPYDVCIIGAGVAGLSAAAALPPGLRVAIVDARQRLGGRVLGAIVGGHAVDVGAAWLHGGLPAGACDGDGAGGGARASNPAAAAMADAGLLRGYHAFPSSRNPWLAPPPAAVAHFFAGGDTGATAAGEDEGAAWGDLLNDVACVAAHAEEGRAAPTFGGVAQVLMRGVPSAGLRARLAWRARALAAWFGAVPADVPLWELGAPPPLEGGAPPLQNGDFPGAHGLPVGGMGGLVSALAAGATAGGGVELLLGAAVTAIDSRCERGGGVLLTRACGAAPLAARHVVVTLPAPLLAASCAAAGGAPAAPPAISFTPPLPSWKAAALLRGGVALAAYKKVVLAWEAPWWPPHAPPFWALHGGPFFCVENYGALKGLPVLVGVLVGEAALRLEEAEGGAHSAAPEAGGAPAPLGFSRSQGGPLLGATAAAVLAAAAAAATTTAPGCAPAPSQRPRPPPSAFPAALLAALRPAATAFGLPAIPPPSDAASSSWESDALAGWGAFSRCGADHEEGDVAALAAPLPCGAGRAGEAARAHGEGVRDALLGRWGGLYFAGDGTEEEHLGSVHAALLSGRRAAGEVARALEAAAAAKSR